MTDSDDSEDRPTDADEFSNTSEDWASLTGRYSPTEILEAERSLGKPASLLDSLMGFDSWESGIDAFDHPFHSQVSVTQQLLRDANNPDPSLLSSQSVEDVQVTSLLQSWGDQEDTDYVASGSVIVEHSSNEPSDTIDLFTGAQPPETTEPEEQESITLEQLLDEIDADYEEFVVLGEKMGFIPQCDVCGSLFLRENAHRLADLDPDGAGDLQCGQCRDSDRSMQ